MDYEIVREQDHYKVYIDGEFYCTADTVSEAAHEIELASINEGKEGEPDESYSKS